MQTVIDTLVSAAKEHLDEAVTNGRLTQEEADAKLVEITERITEMVNTARPARRLISRRRRFWRHPTGVISQLWAATRFDPRNPRQPRTESSPKEPSRPRSIPCTGSAGAFGCDP